MGTVDQILAQRKAEQAAQDVRDRLLEYNTTLLVGISAQLGVTETETVQNNAMDLVWKLRELTNRDVAGLRRG